MRILFNNFIHCYPRSHHHHHHRPIGRYLKILKYIFVFLFGSTWKCDRQVDISFQFFNPSISLKMLDINEWFIWEMNFFKVIFHSNQNLEAK